MEDNSPAFDDERTRAALRRYQLRVLLVPLGILGVIAGVLADGPDNEATGVRSDFAETIGALGGILFVVGLIVLVRSVRTSVMLRRQPWTTRLAWYRVDGQPALVLALDATHTEAVCLVSTIIWRWWRIPRGAGIVLKVAGNPLRWAVTATPDKGDLIVITRPKLGRSRRKLKEIAMSGSRRPLVAGEHPE